MKITIIAVNKGFDKWEVDGRFVELNEKGGWIVKEAGKMDSFSHKSFAEALALIALRHTAEMTGISILDFSVESNELIKGGKNQRIYRISIIEDLLEAV